MRWLQRNRLDANVDLVPNTRANLKSHRYPVPYRQAVKTLVVMEPDGRILTGAQAVFYTISLTKSQTRLIAKVMSFWLPSFFAEPIYRLFARYRRHFAFLSRSA
ncbi:MAG: DCC1-like thiol-disulfide oxidoreductase family protein [Dehalococcoidia bacterium]